MFKRILCCLCAALTVSLLWINIVKPLFGDIADEYEIYLKSPSSMAEVLTVNKLSYRLYTDKKGESCRVTGVSAEDILNMYNATTLFTETTEQSISYYAYSDSIKYRKELGGKIVNLHIAVSDGYITVGSPIIFGSF